MLGFAQKLFIEKAAKIPWKGLIVQKKTFAWPLLEAMQGLQRLSYVDLALAQCFLQDSLLSSEATAALLCHLSMAARQGHLCVSIDGGSIYPAPEEIWLPPVDNSLEPQENQKQLFQELGDLILMGAKMLAPPLLCEVDVNIPFPESPICKQGNRYYLQRYWVQETAFLKNIAKLLSDEGAAKLIALNHETVCGKVDALVSEKKLLPEQAIAIKHGCQNLFTIMTGGPGTGKTYTAGLLIRVFWESLTPEQRKSCRIALAAPTGKAAANLENSIKSALQAFEFPSFTAQTLHTLLGVGRSRRKDVTIVLPFDLLIIDESSMIDVRMMGYLLAAIKPGARLIMLGDRYQLPPVEAGSIFADLVNFLLTHSEKKRHVVEFKTCLRTELRAIVDLAEQINQGNEKKVFELFTNCSEGSGVSYLPFDQGQSTAEQQQRLLIYGVERFPCVSVLPNNPLDLLKEFSRFRILTPMRKGPLGVEALNALFLKDAIARVGRSGCFVAPIMVIQNDYRLELFNGEVGLLVKTYPCNDSDSYRQPEGGYAIFPSKAKDKAEQGIRKIPALMLPKFEYAYCLSVYKSQGSEFEHVVMVLPEGSERFGREALYTGITRARKGLEIWGASTVLRQMMSRVALRHSGISARAANHFAKATVSS